MTDSQQQLTSLFDIIAWVESKNNPHAMRFEPTTFDRIRPNMLTDETVRKIANIHGCSFGTAAMIYSTSFGATQIMGFNLYGMLNYQFNALVYFMNDATTGATNAGVQRSIFEAFVNKIIPDIKWETVVQDMANFPVIRQHFAKLYNGPGAPDAYAAQIVLALQHFGFQVTQ